MFGKYCEFKLTLQNRGQLPNHGLAKQLMANPEDLPNLHVTDSDRDAHEGIARVRAGLTFLQFGVSGSVSKRLVGRR